MTDFAKQTKVKGNTDEWLTPESAVYVCHNILPQNIIYE